MSEVSMWLFPVALASVVGLFICIRNGPSWTWGMCAQQALILVVSIIGFYFLYGPLPAPYAMARHDYALYCTVIAWTMFLIFTIGQRLLIDQLSLDLSLFRVQQAQRRAKLVRLFAWGPPGEYWSDMSRALSLYHERRVQEADEIVRAWRKDPRAPSAARESLVGFFMLGRVLMQNWQDIVDLFERNQSTFAEARSFVPYQLAGRAYAELKRFPEAEECIRKANMEPGKTSATNLDINFMTLFALFGASKELEGVLKRCGDYMALPQYVRDYWLGRCHAVRGDAPHAVQWLERAKQHTPRQMEIWHARIDTWLNQQRANLASGENPPNQAADELLCANAEKTYLRLRTIADVLRPAETRAGTIWLLVGLLLAYVISNSSPILHKTLYSLGELSAPALLHGELWRVITYQFLHGNSAHLFLNAFALFIFGKTVENVYGTARFLVIFFASGILSGVFQVIIVPYDSAIGASGAILGVFGAATAGIIKLKHILPSGIRKRELRWMASIAIVQVLVDQIVNAVAAVTDKSPDGTRIAAFAHLGGMVIGFVIGMLLPTRTFTRYEE